MIIGAFRAVTADVGAEAGKHGLRRALKDNEGTDGSEGSYVPYLAGMSGNAVQKEEVVRRKGGTVEISSQNLCSKGKMFILKQETSFKDAVDEGELIRGESVIGACSVVDRAKLCSEIEMMTGSVENAGEGDIIAKRGFTSPGRAQQQHGSDRECIVSFHDVLRENGLLCGCRM